MPLWNHCRICEKPKSKKLLRRQWSNVRLEGLPLLHVLLLLHPLRRKRRRLYRNHNLLKKIPLRRQKSLRHPNQQLNQLYVHSMLVLKKIICLYPFVGEEASRSFWIDYSGTSSQKSSGKRSFEACWKNGGDCCCREPRYRQIQAHS